MSGDIITPQDLELSALRAWKERALEAERKLLAERAAVVKYLRDHAFDLYNIAAKDEVYELAGAIERGEHVP